MDYKLTILIILVPFLVFSASKDRYFLESKQDQTNQFSKTLPIEVLLEYANESDALSKTGKVDKIVKGEADIFLMKIDKNGVVTKTKVKDKKPKAIK